MTLTKKIKQFKPVLFIVPAFIFYIMFLIIPIIKTVKFSFFAWDGASPVMTFIGLDNYNRLIHDAVFWRSIEHNIFWIISTIILPVGVGLILALLLSSALIRRKMIFRVSYFVPAILSLVSVGIIWNWIYNPDFGILSTFLRSIGLGQLTMSWLGEENTVLPALIVAGSWTYYGFCMVVFLAAIQGLDKSYFEVAKIEGANVFQTFIKITLPLLKNTTTLLVLNSLIGSFKVFDIIFIMTKGGPYHTSEVAATYMYSQAFQLNDVGYGSAVSIGLAIIIALCSAIYFKYAERQE